MKILHISTHDSGGAGEAAYRTRKGLKSKGFDSDFLAMFCLSNKPDVLCVKKRGKPSDLIFKAKHKITSTVLRLTDRNYYYFDNGRFEINDYSEIINILGYTPNIVILYWTSFFYKSEGCATTSCTEEL